MRANQLAVKTARSIVQEAKELDHDKRGKYLKWSYDSECTARLAAMLNAAKSVAPIAAYGSQFDTNSWVLNCLNGTVDLRTGKLRSHSPADMITKLAPVQFDPTAKLELWDNFLRTATDNDDSMVEFLQVAVGYSSTGSTAEEKLFFVWGPTASGKSTLLEAVKATLGDYAQTANFESFIRRQQVGSARNDIAKLAGARFVVSIEVDEGKRLAEGLVKMLTGGDTISARFLYKEEFEFMPQFKLWLAANDAPQVKDTDEALWRRILRVPFEHTIPEQDQDPKVKATLRDAKIAGPAILAWIVQGCLKWQQQGLRVPEVIEQSTEEYRQSQDPLREFYEADCIFRPTAFVPIKDLKEAYEKWAEEVGIERKCKLGRKDFNERLQAKGCVQKPTRYVDAGTTKNSRCWHGVTLKSSPKYRKNGDVEQQNQGKFPF